MTPPRAAEFLEFALATARAAGEVILPHFRAPLDVADKGGGKGYDPVTIADRAAESVISRGDCEGLSRPRHPRRRARPARRRVALHVGDRSDRRHAQLHPRPDALGDADRASRRRAHRRRRRPSALRRRIVRCDGRRAGGVAPWQRSADACHAPLRVRRRCRRRVHRSEDVRNRSRARCVRPGREHARASPAGAAIATRTACSRWA